MQDRKRWYVRRKPVSEMLRSVYRQKMPLSCLDLTVREAHLGRWSQDPKTGRTYERKRSEHAARANPCKSGAVHI